jgi:DNA-directed RNA polymerase I subunit RPA1
LLSAQAQELLRSLKGDTPLMQMDMVWKELQQHVDHVLDRDMNRSASTKGNTWGFKQVIERKQGLFRMNMMGKRVNFAARTVITPDPNLDIDEVGLPEVFAKKLTYRTAVTHWNVEELRQAVINGPDIHPGALFVESESGFRTIINGNSQSTREALAKTLLTPGASDNPDCGIKYVHRHLKNGDFMLLNRQPTLHKPSIMAHRARVLKGHKVMRLHYAICKSYNADFDGDEMNAHYPQNEVARSEACTIVNVCKQYLVPKDGSPLQGLIQDHIIAGTGLIFFC